MEGCSPVVLETASEERSVDPAGKEACLRRGRRRRGRAGPRAFGSGPLTLNARGVWPCFPSPTLLPTLRHTQGRVWRSPSQLHLGKPAPVLSLRVDPTPSLFQRQAVSFSPRPCHLAPEASPSPSFFSESGPALLFSEQALPVFPARVRPLPLTRSRPSLPSWS